MPSTSSRMPARTGTDGRGGRLRAVQATASASTSRATRNFISRPTRSLLRPRCAGRAGRRGPGAGAVLIVPVAVPRGETPVPVSGALGPTARSWLSSAPWARPSGASPPRMWFKNSRDNYLIFVITRVEAGDRAPSRCSAPEWPCWPAVGGQRLPVVDTWTTRPLCTATAARPPPVPCLPPVRPQAECPGDGRPARRIDGTRARLRRKCQVRACGSASGAGQRRSLRDRHRDGSPEPVHVLGQLLDESTGSPVDDELSPTCAHSWGQLLDVSTRDHVRRAHRPPATPVEQPSRCPASATCGQVDVTRRLCRAELRCASEALRDATACRSEPRRLAAGDGTWPRCGPEDRRVTAGRGS